MQGCNRVKLANLRKNKEPLLHCSVFIELKAKGMEKLKELQSDIARNSPVLRFLSIGWTLRQKRGLTLFCPWREYVLGAQYERVLPASSVANMYPFNLKRRKQIHTAHIGRDKYGTNILRDFLTAEPRTRLQAISSSRQQRSGQRVIFETHSHQYP